MKELIKNIYSFLGYAENLCNKNREDAEDMIQELAFNVIKNKDIFLSKDNTAQRNMMAWKLRQISIDKWRTRKNIVQIDLEAEIKNICHNNVFGKFLEADLMNQLSQLRETHYILLKMSFEGYTKEEIISIMNITKYTYYEYKCRALKTLKSKIK